MNTSKNKPPGFKNWTTMVLAFLLAFVMIGQANATVTYSSSTGLNVPVNGTTIWMKLNTISGSVGNFTIGKIGGTAFAASSNFRITKNGATVTDVPYYAGQLTASFNIDLGSTAGSAYWRAQRYTSSDAVPLDPNVVSGYVYVTTTVVSVPTPTPGTDTNGNNTSSATAINLNTNVSASINYGGDIDYFRIAPSGAGTLTVYTTGGTDTYGTLLGSGGAVITANDDATTSERNFRIQYPVPASGTYFIAVRHYSSTSTGGYALRADFSGASSSANPFVAKFDSFIATKKGTRTNMDGAYGAQCVDLMHAYIQDVLTAPYSTHGLRGNAYSIYANAASSTIINTTSFGKVRLDKIANTPTGIPKKGDIIFWRKASANGYAGHVAIFISGNAASFTSIDQNWVNASATNGSAAAIVTHNYTSTGGVVGWLRPVDIPN